MQRDGESAQTQAATGPERRARREKAAREALRGAQNRSTTLRGMASLPPPQRDRPVALSIITPGHTGGTQDTSRPIAIGAMDVGTTWPGHCLTDDCYWPL